MSGDIDITGPLINTPGMEKQSHLLCEGGNTSNNNTSEETYAYAGLGGSDVLSGSTPPSLYDDALNGTPFFSSGNGGGKVDICRYIILLMCWMFCFIILSPTN